MSITDSNSVLILGAGVSKPFGLPLGGELLTQIQKQIAEERRRNPYPPQVFDPVANFPRHACLTIKAFRELPIHGAIAAECMDENSNVDFTALNSYLEKLGNLERLLEDQTSETVDDFIVENPSYALLTKIGIATCFMKSCYDWSDGASTCPKPFPARMFKTIDDNEPSDKACRRPANHRNWIHLLINIVRHGIRLESVTPQNKIKIITFNYDKILEFVLSKQFSNTESNYSDYTNYIDILHVHGECGDLGDNIVHPGKTCRTWAKGINVVNEPDSTVPEQVKKAREQAKGLIQSAKKIYACGFSFAASNCRLLGLDSTEKAVGSNRLISYCNYDGNVGVKLSVEKYKRYKPKGLADLRYGRIEEAAGSVERPLGVADWLKLGYLGELPG